MSSFCSQLLFTFLLLLNLIKACNPTLSYPTIMNIQLLSSQERKILLTMQNKDSTTVCATYDIDEEVFSDEMECSTYTNDILEFSSDTDATTTRVNSITSNVGIDITRDTHSFVIKWTEIPEVENITIDSSQIESFTLDSNAKNEYTTFIRLTDDDIYAIKFDSEVLNSGYNIYIVQSNQYFNLESEIKSYDQFAFMIMDDKFSECPTSILYQYETSISDDNDYYNLNLTLIDTEHNIGVDTRNDMAYYWGYSSAFTVFDIFEDEITLQRYNFVPPDDFPSNAFIIKPKTNLYAIIIINMIIYCVYK